jgi:hypothetical protein
VLEVADKPGGQIRLTAQSVRRRVLFGIVDWRLERCLEQGVRFHYNTLADRERVLAERPDVVIIATGGLPHTEVLTSGNEYADSTWDVISGAKLEIMTPDRSFAPEVMAMNLVPFINHGRPARWVVLRPQGPCDEPRRGGR